MRCRLRNNWQNLDVNLSLDDIDMESFIQVHDLGDDLDATRELFDAFIKEDPQAQAVSWLFYHHRRLK